MTVPRRRKLKLRPKFYVLKGQKWPNGDFEEGDIPGVVFVVQDIVKRIREEIDDHEDLSVKKLAEEADVSMQTLYDFLNGDSWGTLTLIYSLECALEQPLWGKDHLHPRWESTVRERSKS